MHLEWQAAEVGPSESRDVVLVTVREDHAFRYRRELLERLRVEEALRRVDQESRVASLHQEAVGLGVLPTGSVRDQPNM